MKFCEKCGKKATRLVWIGTVKRDHPLKPNGDPNFEDYASRDFDSYSEAGTYLCDDCDDDDIRGGNKFCADCGCAYADCLCESL